ncbi:MAG: YadA-like family protein [Neisseriaceae bacterium]|nr:YadA-like family protein [Neisseriaceae bacterium]
MNKTFRVIFNHTTGQWVAVSELARVNGKKHTHNNNNCTVSGCLKKAFAPLCLALMGVFCVPTVFAAEVDIPCKYDNATYSIRCGIPNTASGYRSSAVGYDNTASGSYSSALGRLNTASGRYSSAFGSSSQALSNHSHAFGGYNNYSVDGASSVTMGDGAVAVGYRNNYKSTGAVTVGEESTAVGVRNSASGLYSSALGRLNTASGEDSSAVGSENIASGNYSSAVGYYNTASGEDSSAVGRGNTASGNSSSAVGYSNYALSADSQAFGGQNNYSGSGISSVTMGTGAVAVGYRNNYKQTGAVTVGEESTAVGVRNSASGDYSSAVGSANTASGQYSSAMGYYNTASGDYSSAMGSKNTASGKYSATVGYSNTASGSASAAVGFWNTASGYVSSAMGYINTASGQRSSAVGFGNTASGVASSAVGTENTAKGFYSSALGAYNTAEVDFGTAVGFGSLANRDQGTKGVYAPANLDSLDAKGKAAWQATSAALAVGNPDNTNLEYYDPNTDSYVEITTPITRQITGVAAGSEDTDAVNVAQLKEVAALASGGSFSPFTVSDGGSGSFTVGSAGNLKMVGSNANITTTASGDTVTFALNNDLTLTSVSTGGVKLSANGLNNGGKKITGVANGTANTDAVNVGQLNTAITNAGTAAQTWVNTQGFAKTADLSAYAKTTDLTPYAKTADLANYAKQSDMTAAKSDISKLKSDKADKSWVTTELAKVSSGGSVDLSEYSKTAEMNTAINTAKTEAVTDANAYTDSKLGDKADKSWVTTKISEAALGGVDLSEYAKTADANAYADTAANTAETNANAYTDSKLGDYAKQSDMTAAKSDIGKLKTDLGTAQSDIGNLKSELSTLTLTSGAYSHITVAGETGDFQVKNTETAKFVGDGKNITTDASGGEVKISLAKDIEVDSVKVGNNGVAITQNGLNNGGQVISGVAAGVRPTDAVNVAQLHNAVGGAYARIESVEKHANAGTAQSLAAANMPTASQPGEGMLAISGGVYRGEQGYAIGYSQLSENGRWVIRATGSGNSRNHFGGAVGVGFKLF